MDSDNSSTFASAIPPATSPTTVATAASSPPTAGKVRRCICGKWMNSLTYDFHSCCIDCRSRECDLDVRCDECIDVSDDKMLTYIKYRLSLQRKSRYRQRSKSNVQIDAPTGDGHIDAVAEDPSPDRSPSVVSIQASVSDGASVNVI